ncbi:hypothetical protein MMC18_007462 [Xylographa bjoerkii]|nr:hypothetical protein [Xylographa bjoerkii]MCJ1394508.1 hypothetical protein [Xylographa bjoerkii]MCJ1394582.1 hypothetical protein [Xylographa bjoerkii]
MHSSLVRLQNVFGFFTTVAFTIAALVALSVVVSPQAPSASIALRNVQVVKGRPHYYSNTKEEYAHIKFDLEADFSSLFNWNTKQLFVYVLATYPSLTPSSPPSQAIIWDTIIASPSQQHPLNPLEVLGLSSTPASKSSSSTKSKSKSKASSAPTPKVTVKPGVLSLKNVKPKYQITDVSGKLADRGNVTLEVGWNVQPWVGALTWTMRDGSGWGRWKGVKGGRSEVFELPGLKGKKVETTVGTSGVPRAGEASPVVGV